MNNIVLYFTATGTTKKAAEGLAKLLKSEIAEIKAVERYTSEDLDWTNKNSRTTLEYQNPTIRPDFIIEKDILNYSNVFIVFPIWWYTAPSIIKSFLERNDFTNKKVVIFATSGGSTLTSTMKDLRNYYPNINFVEGKLLNRYLLEDELNEWIKKNL